MEDKTLRDAQYRKGLSIAYFNSLNSAIALVIASVPKTTTLGKKIEMIDQVKTTFLDKYKAYYSETIAGVGAAYHADITIRNMRATKSKDELRKVWMEMSEDERRDGEIIKVKSELLKKYNEKAHDAPAEQGVATKA